MLTPDTYPFPDTLLQLRNRATTPMPASCMVAWLQQNAGGTQPLMAQILRYKARHLVSNDSTTDMKELHLKMEESRLMNASLQAFSPMQEC